MITDQQLLEWIRKQIDIIRENAMYCHKNGFTESFEQYNETLTYLNRMASVMEEKVKQECPE